MHPEPQSEREDLVYHEHKFVSSSAPDKKAQRDNSQEELHGTVVRQPNNPLDIAVIRLAELERNIEQRYMKRLFYFQPFRSHWIMSLYLLHRLLPVMLSHSRDSQPHIFLFLKQVSL